MYCMDLRSPPLTPLKSARLKALYQYNSKPEVTKYSTPVKTCIAKLFKINACFVLWRPTWTCTKRKSDRQLGFIHGLPSSMSTK